MSMNTIDFIYSYSLFMNNVLFMKRIDLSRQHQGSRKAVRVSHSRSGLAKAHGAIMGGREAGLR